MPAESARRSPGLVVAGVVLQALAYLTLFYSAELSHYSAWLMIAGLAISLPGLILLAAPRQQSDLGWFRLSALMLGLILLLGFGGALLLPADTATDPLILGLPKRAALVLLGIGVVPFLILPAIHAWRFDAVGLDPEGLANLRRESARLRDDSRESP
jgi:hypothetical protein